MVGSGEDPLPSTKNNGATTETAAKEGRGKEENVATFAALRIRASKVG